MVATFRSAQRVANIGVLSVFFIRILSAALAYVLFAVVGRTTNLATYNQFALLFTVINFFGPVGSLGTASLLFKYWPTASYRRPEAKKEFLSALATIVLSSGLLSAIFAQAFIRYTTHAVALVYPVVAACVLVSALTELLFAAYRLLHSIVIGVVLRELLWRSIFITALLTLHNLGLELSTAGVTAFLMLAYSTTLAIFIAGSWSLLSLKMTTKYSDRLPPLRQILIFFLLFFLSTASVHLDTLLLGIRGPSTELGAFFSAQRVVQVLYFISQSIGTFASPAVASDFAEGSLSKITHQSRWAAATGLLVSLPIALLLLFFGDSVLGFFRPEFRDYWYLLVALAAGPLIYAGLGYHAIIPTYCGQEHSYLLGRILILVAFVPIKLIIVTHFNLLAYAIASSLEVTLFSIFGALVSRLYCKIPAV